MEIQPQKADDSHRNVITTYLTAITPVSLHVHVNVSEESIVLCKAFEEEQKQLPTTDIVDGIIVICLFACSA